VTLTVMAAASLNRPFHEIGELFSRQNPGTVVEFTFAGSQQLVTQLGSGAQADVLATANKKTMDTAIESGRIERGNEQVFVQNRLVVITPAANPGGLAALQDLSRPGLKIVFAAKEVPVGQYSLDFLEQAAQDASFPLAFKDGVLANVVSYEDNVKAVLAKVALGEADAGIVYTSDAAGDPASQVKVLEIPNSLNVIAGYPIAAVSGSTHPVQAAAFVALVLSSEGQDILAKYGFLPVR
jgi:molybdate transport system substrate-binding protein